jgi:uncharacterized protein YjbJ (UPF0337 family)
MDDAKRLQFEGKWDQMKGRVRESWGVLTDDDLDRTQGKRDHVVGLIKKKTGDNAESSSVGSTTSWISESGRAGTTLV